MPEQTDPPPVDLRTGPQVVHPGQRIAREVLGSRARRALLRSPNSPIIRAQHCDPLPGQVVRQYQERPVPEHCLVAVLRPRSGDQHHRRKRPSALRVGQSGRQPHSVHRVLVGDFLVLVRIRPLGLLRALALRQLRHAPHCQRQRRSGLVPLTFGLLPIGAQPPLEPAAHGRHLHPQHAIFHGDPGDWDPHRPLVGAVHSPSQGPVLLPADVEDEA